MASISLQPGIIYGPVLSRRLGRSIGINLLPVDRKVCSFDCIYCQYGRTAVLTTAPSHEMLPTAETVFSAVEKALKKPRTIDVLTFSGNGEPTLHPEFSEIVRGVRRLVDRIRPNVKIALLSNASRVMEDEIQSTLQWIDLPIMKLDTGDRDTFQAINRPVTSIKFESIVSGLKSIKNLVLQSVLIDGDVSNTKGDAFCTWKALICELHPRKVQIYSSERPTAESSVICVGGNRLKRIAEDLRSTYGVDNEAFWRE